MKLSRSSGRLEAFTRVELLAVLAVSAALVGLAWPVLANGKSRSDSERCLDRMRLLIQAWQVYASDHEDRVLNNFGISEILQEVSQRRYHNWANNIMTWTPDGVAWTSQTNTAWLKEGPFGPYASEPKLYRCPADNFASPAMVRAGIPHRLRSVSMNAFFGLFSSSRTDPTLSGRNWAFPDLRQFLKSSECPKSEKTWVFIDEHPDSINDGYFLNNGTSSTWGDLPGSNHDNGAGLAFADGHVQLRFWLSATTRTPVRFVYSQPRPFDQAGREDFQWWRERTGFIRRDGTALYGY